MIYVESTENKIKEQVQWRSSITEHIGEMKHELKSNHRLRNGYARQTLNLDANPAYEQEINK